MFTAIMKWDKDGNIEKYQSFETRKEAEEHVERFKEQYPLAFAHGNLMGPPHRWRVIVQGHLEKKHPVESEA